MNGINDLYEMLVSNFTDGFTYTSETTTVVEESGWGASAYTSSGTTYLRSMPFQVTTKTVEETTHPNIPAFVTAGIVLLVVITIGVVISKVLKK